jgi:hypothetical protein
MEQPTTEAPAVDQTPDIQLFNAGQTIELLSQLLGATLLKLAKAEGREPTSHVIISQADVDQLEGHELQHGDTREGIAIRVAPVSPRN